MVFVAFFPVCGKDTERWWGEGDREQTRGEGGATEKDSHAWPPTTHTCTIWSHVWNPLMSWPQGSHSGAQEEQLMGCKDQGCFVIFFLFVTLNLPYAVITGAMFLFIPWELIWVDLEEVQNGHKGFCTDTETSHYTTVRHSLFIMSLDWFTLN